MLVPALELSGLELGGKRHSLDIEIIEFLGLVPLLWTPSGCQPTRLGTNAGKKPLDSTLHAHLALLSHPIHHDPQEPATLVSLSEALALAQALFIRHDNALDTKGKIKGWLRSFAAAGSRWAVSDVVSC